MFPPEILENILIYCDGITLKAACKVNYVWRDVVDYLTRETNIWKNCCHNDIPENELIQYLNKWVQTDDENDQNKWFRIYENWFHWHDIKNNIDFDVKQMENIRRISCINVAGNYICIGFENGTVRIYSSNFEYVKTYSHFNIPVCDVSLVCDDNNLKPTEVLVYQGQQVYIDDFLDTGYLPAVFPTCYKYSSFKKYICSVTRCGKITIAKIGTDNEARRKIFNVITYVRIYSPEIVASVKLWEGVCTIVVNNKVKIISYNECSQKPNVIAMEKARLEFSYEYGVLPRDIYIFNNKIIISLMKSFDSGNNQMFELYILGEKKHHKKMFVPWETYKCNISCLFLYGNTFVVALVSGMVYYYEVQDWKLFDITNYSYKENISSLCPIVSIDAIECHGRRILYIATNNQLYQVTGHSIPSFDEDF